MSELLFVSLIDLFLECYNRIQRIPKLCTLMDKF